MGTGLRQPITPKIPDRNSPSNHMEPWETTNISKLQKKPTPSFRAMPQNTIETSKNSSKPLNKTLRPASRLTTAHTCLAPTANSFQDQNEHKNIPKSCRTPPAYHIPSASPNMRNISPLSVHISSASAPITVRLFGCYMLPTFTKAVSEECTFKFGAFCKTSKGTRLGLIRSHKSEVSGKTFETFDSKFAGP